MAFTISGIIQQIGNTESIPYQDKVFKKRELVLDCSYRNQFTGQIERPNYPKFEFTGIHVDDLNNFQLGEIVTVSFSLNGSRSEKDGQVRYFTNIQGFKIERYQARASMQQQGGNYGAQAVNTPPATYTPQAAGIMPQAASQAAISNANATSTYPAAINEQSRSIAEDKDELPF